MSGIGLSQAITQSLNADSAPVYNKASGLHRQTEREQKVKGEKSLKDDFMKIFLTQMLKQNPMKPNDSSMMMQQMGQLTALQSTEDLQKSVKQLTNNLGMSQLLTAAQLVGRHAQVVSSIAPLIPNGESGSASLKGSVVVTRPATNVVISIKDSAGIEVAKINKGDSGNGILDFEWDGMIEKNGEKSLGTDEFYHISASAEIDGVHTSLNTGGLFEVNSVTMDPSDKHTILNLNGAGGMSLDQLIKIT